MLAGTHKESLSLAHPHHLIHNAVLLMDLSIRSNTVALDPSQVPIWISVATDQQYFQVATTTILVYYTSKHYSYNSTSFQVKLTKPKLQHWTRRWACYAFESRVYQYPNFISARKVKYFWVRTSVYAVHWLLTIPRVFD